MILEPESDLEGLRIPYFYRAFYVYKYATGVSAALADRVAQESSVVIFVIRRFLVLRGFFKKSTTEVTEDTESC
jgi:hypothetical protein